MVWIFLLRAVDTDDPSVGDVLASCLGYLLLFHECNSLGGSCWAPNFFAKQLAPNFLVLGVLEEVSIFQEVDGFVIKNCIGKVTKELERILA
jgi:hypothetical protein